MVNLFTLDLYLPPKFLFLQLFQLTKKIVGEIFLAEELQIKK